ncbi:MAG: hypothetical protein LLF92_07705 [Planctomycetaceae bacterium]|nr:hypothetical protein [Planctomycetaceae bacterium]
MAVNKHIIRYFLYFSIVITADICLAVTKSADFNDDGKVNFMDFSIFSNNWFAENVNSAIDLSGSAGIPDGQVNFYDLGVFANDFLAVRYIMGSHKSNNEKLYIWESYNGTSWFLRGNNPVYENPNLPHTATDPTNPINLMNVVRDPSIMKLNNKYYVVYTTNNIPYHYRGNTFGVASSNDLQNWEYITDVYCGSFLYTWAPEWFVDEDNSIHVFVALNYKIYEMHPLNEEFTQWSTPVFVQGDWGTTTYMIDPFVIKIDGTYYLWYKGPKRLTYQNIEYGTSSSLTSGYTIQGSGDWTNWNDGIGNIEGESLVKIDDNTWRIYFDDYVDGGIYYCESSDLFQTWTPRRLISSESFIPAHPTVIHFDE